MKWSQEIYSKAWNFATLAHHGQMFGGYEEGMQIDYINHIGSVAMEIIWSFSETQEYDQNLAIQCALLHDTLEDTQTTYKTLNSHFSRTVADGVLALTKNKKLPTKGAQLRDSLTRIKKQSKEIWMVKLADRITNLYHPPFYWDKDKIKGYREEALVIYHSLKSAHPALAARLSLKIEEYQKFMS